MIISASKWSSKKHLKCIGLTAAHKKTLRFAGLCYGTDYAVEKKEIDETKVSMCPRSLQS